MKPTQGSHHSSPARAGIWLTLAGLIVLASRTTIATPQLSLEDQWNSYSDMRNVCAPTTHFINYNGSSSHLVPVKRCACNACVIEGEKCSPVKPMMVKRAVEKEISRKKYYVLQDFEEHTNCTCKP